jgi:hypothetical protein
MPKKNDIQQAAKKPNARTHYTPKELLELKRCAEDPLYFIENFMWVKTINSRQKIVPFQYQKDLICTFAGSRYSIALCGRQLGKTTCAVGYMLWRAMFKPDQTILIVANILSQALEIMQRIRFSYEELPDYIRAGAVTYNKGSLDFDNGSRIISRATTPDAGRGLTVSLLYIDELSFVAPSMQEEFWTSISPTLSTGGDCIITSTPNSDEDLFARLWRAAEDNRDAFGNPNPNGLGKNGFKAIKVLWDAHPDRDEEWARQEMSKIGEEKFRREHGCEFITFDETLVNGLVLANLQSIEPKQLMGQTRWYSDPEPNKVFLVALDPAIGTQSDASAIEVYQLPEMIQIAEWQSNKTVIKNQVQILRDILQYLRTSLKANPMQNGDPEIYYTIENNTVGEAALVVIENTGEEFFPGTFVHEPKMRGHVKRYRKGLNTTHKTKIAACARLKSLIESGRMTVRSRGLISELKNYVAAGLTFNAKPGAHDDLVSATLLCIRILDIIQNWDPEMTERLKETLESGEVDVEPMPLAILMN